MTVIVSWAHNLTYFQSWSEMQTDYHHQTEEEGFARDLSQNQYKSQIDWMRNATDDDIKTGKYDPEYVNQQFYTDLYHDIYYSRYGGHDYVRDLQAMSRFERLNVNGLYHGLYTNVASGVLDRVPADFANRSAIVANCNRYTPQSSGREGLLAVLTAYF